ncbi:MAG: hypothetical protein E7541_02905 [Ruminococcaceae bacterium]|nr:hypothetical protein [Oscillospiraceae bacterium]
MKRTDTAILRRQAHTVPASLSLLWCLYGLLAPRALLYGEVAPFGVALAAAAPYGAGPITAATLLGYLLAGQITGPLRYLAAVLLTVGGRWVLAAIPEWKGHRAVGAGLAFAATLVTGLLLIWPLGPDGYTVLLIVAESAVAGGGAFFFATAMDWLYGAVTSPPEEVPLLTHPRQASLILTGAIGVMAIATLTVGDFSPGRAVAILLTLVLARTGREAGGCMAGVILGTAVALATPDQAVPAMAMAAGGLCAGVFSRFGKALGAGAFLVAAGVVALPETDPGILLFLYEIFAAGVLFVLLPRRWDHALAHLFIRGREAPAVDGYRTAVTLRLGAAAHAITEVADTVEEVSRRLSRRGDADVGSVLEQSCHTVCATCPLQAVCDGENREERLGALDALRPLLAAEGQVTGRDLPGFLARQCRRKDRLAEEITGRYRRYQQQAAAWQRLGELRDALRNQWGATGELLDALSHQLSRPEEADTVLAARVQAVCADHGMPVKTVLCTRDTTNRLTVEILTAEVGVRTEAGRWRRQMQQVCGRTFAPATLVQDGEDVRITLTEKPRYRLEIGLYQHCCDGERLCGDAVDRFTQQGETVLLLSDGMGSGGRAAVDGAMTVGLCARLWQAGFSPDCILKTVNAALMVKSREESLATLDVAVIDRHSGRLDSFKAGAAATLLRSHGRVSRLERSSLPVGILPEVTFSHSRDWLAEGDILLMGSDGAYPTGVAAVEELLAAFPEEEGMQVLADRVGDAARQAGQEHPDDVTVLAVRLLKE